MDEKFEIRLIRNAARGMRECADTLDKILADLTGAETAPKEGAVEKPVTLEDVRGLLADKSRAGHTAEVKALLIKHGADRLSGIDPANYAVLMADAEGL